MHLTAADLLCYWSPNVDSLYVAQSEAAAPVLECNLEKDYLLVGCLLRVFMS